MTTEEALTLTEEEQALETIARNQLAIKELQEQNDVLKGFFKERNEAYPAGSNKHVGKFYIKVSTNVRVDDTLAQVELSTSEYDRLSKKVIDGARAKKILPPERYAKIQKQYDNKIEVGIL